MVLRRIFLGLFIDLFEGLLLFLVVGCLGRTIADFYLE